MTASKFAIVGGGIVGASVAYHLSERTDGPITVYERDELASETTFKSTAMVGEGGPAPHHRMKRYGFRLYNDFFADPEASPRYRQSGRLRVATSASGAATLERLATADSEHGEDESSGPGPRGLANSMAEFIPGDEVQESVVVPPLETSLVEGALYRPKYGHVLSDDRTLGARDLALEFAERARENGVTFETNTEVTDIVAEDGSVAGVETDGRGFVEADEVVCAAGPWTVQLAETVGIDVPAEHMLSPVYAMEPERPFRFSMPTIKSHESSVGIHRKRDDLLLVTYTPGEDEGEPRYDPGDVGEAELDEFRSTAVQEAERLVPELRDAELTDEWVGVGVNTPDGDPIVGRTAIEGVSLAVTMSGIQLAPAVGSIVARQLVEDTPTEYYDSVSISRFDGYTDPWDGG